MPRVIGKVEGRGNGIKTVIFNVMDLSLALKRDPGEVCKFFGTELGAQARRAETFGFTLGTKPGDKRAGTCSERRRFQIVPFDCLGLPRLDDEQPRPKRYEALDSPPQNGNKTAVLCHHMENYLTSCRGQRNRMPTFSSQPPPPLDYRHTVLVFTQTRYNEENERAIVNGAHTNATLQQLVHKYVELFVLCPNCRLPESSEFLPLLRCTF